MSSDATEQSVWNAPPGVTFEPLDRALRSVDREQVSELQRQAKRDVKDRVEAYETPVTEETLRRSLP